MLPRKKAYAITHQCLVTVESVLVLHEEKKERKEKRKNVLHDSVTFREVLQTVCAQDILIQKPASFYNKLTQPTRALLNAQKQVHNLQPETHRQACFDILLAVCLG